MILGRLTLEQKELLDNVQFGGGNFYNPVEDINGNWFISVEEMEQSELEFLKTLPLEEFIPKPFEEIFTIEITGNDYTIQGS